MKTDTTRIPARPCRWTKRSRFSVRPLRSKRPSGPPGALECVRAGYIPGGLNNNRDFAECVVEYDDGVPEDLRALLFDPQTAGGLLISVASDDSAQLTGLLNAAGVSAVQIGEVLAKTKPLIAVQL